MKPTLTFLSALLCILSAASHGEEVARDSPVLVEAEGFATSRRLGGRSAVHGHHGIAVSARPRPGPAGGGCDDGSRVSRGRHLSRLGAHQGLGGAMEGTRHAGAVSGARQRHARSTTTFGTVGAEWHWQDGGSVELPAGKVSLALHDLTGFEGRCDAILFTRDPEVRAAECGSGDGGVSPEACSACRSNRSRRASSISSSPAAASPGPARRFRRRGWA